VPRDVSIVGIDDHDLSDFFGLTTVAQFPRGQGEKAAEMLMEELAPSPLAELPATTPLPFELKVRSSTARPSA
jgi:DNA-binding LacI/PurR family transcriptional regulator